MTHFSPRYAPGNPIQMKDLLSEARAIFPETILAYDFSAMTFPVVETKRFKMLWTINSQGLIIINQE